LAAVTQDIQLLRHRPLQHMQMTVAQREKMRVTYTIDPLPLCAIPWWPCIFTAWIPWCAAPGIVFGSMFATSSAMPSHTSNHADELNICWHAC
jgi:hypothetical protein